LLLQEPKSLGGEDLRTVYRKDIDQPDAPRVAVDRVDDASEDRVKRFILEGMEEVADREIVGHREFRCVGDHDLYVPASMLMSPRRQTAASGLGQGGRDLDADDSVEGPSCGLMDDPTLSASEVDEGIVIGDSEVAERSG
jgi:hypothetical protein